MAGTTKFKFLTDVVMTRGEYLRSAHKDDVTYDWPDDACDPYNSADAYLPSSGHSRRAAARRAVGSSAIPGTGHGTGK